MRRHVGFAESNPHLVAEQLVKDGVGVVHRINQPDLIGVAVNRQAVCGPQRRRIHDVRNDRAGLAEQVPLHASLQFPQSNPGAHHEASLCRITQPACAVRQWPAPR